MKFCKSLLPLFIVSTTIQSIANPYLDHFLGNELHALQNEENKIAHEAQMISLLRTIPASEERESRAASSKIVVHVVDSLGEPYTGYSVPSVYDRYGYSYRMSESSSVDGKFYCNNLYPGEYTVTYLDNFYDYKLPNEVNWFTIGDDVYDAGTIPFVATSYTTTTSQDTLRLDLTLFSDDTKETAFTGSRVSISGHLIPTSSIGSVTYADIVSFSGSMAYGSSDLSITAIGPEGDYYALITRGGYFDGENLSIVPQWLTGESIGELPTTLSLTKEVDTLPFTIEQAGFVRITYSPAIPADHWYADAGLVLVDENGYTHGDLYEDNGIITARSAIAPGEYYLKTGVNSYYFKRDQFYPGVADISQTRKVVVTAGDTTNLRITLTPNEQELFPEYASDAAVRAQVTYEDGTPVNNGTLWIEYDRSNSNRGTGISNGESVKGVASGEKFHISVEDDDNRYIGSADYQNGKLYTVTPSETLDVAIVLPSAGNIVGIVENSTASFNDHQGLITYEVTAIASGKSNPNQLGNTGTASTAGGYRIENCNEGTYDVSLTPIYLSRGNLSSQLTGLAGAAKTDVAVVSNEDSEVNFQVPTVSGMISGTLLSPSLEGDSYMAFAVRPDGTVASSAITNSGYSNDEKDYTFGLIARDPYMWNNARKTTTNLDFPVDLPLLAKGDYYVAVVAVKASGLMQIQWYGQESTSPYNIKALESYSEVLLSETIPADAEIITLDSDNSAVELLNFGTVPVKQMSFSSDQLQLKGVYNGVVSLSGIEEPTTLKLYSFNGRLITSTLLSPGMTNWNMSDAGISQGSYILSIQSETQNYSYPLIIQ